MRFNHSTGSLLLGDCLERMSEIPDGSVDMILCDLPYGTTACKWDTVIPFAPLWEHYWRVAKRNAAIVLTASQPFTSALVMSQANSFKYGLIWSKSRTGGFWDAKFRPLKSHEDILVFSRGGCSNGSIEPMTYNPQGLLPSNEQWSAKPVGANSRTGSAKTGRRELSNYPRSIMVFESVSKPIHNTQKPVALFEYLIKTYTDPGALVLDNCAGSGTTAIAAHRSGRRSLLIERDLGYFLAACGRIWRECEAA